MKVSDQTRDNIFSIVERDLNPSLLRVASYLAFAFGVGGAFSMFLCGQFGIGLSSFAMDFSHSIHTQMGAMQCAMVCGAIFSIVPAALLRIVSHPLFFRNIIRRHSLLEAGITLAVGLLAYSHGNFKLEIINVLIWSLSAYCMFKIIGLLIDRYLPQFELDTFFSAS